tara:strand:- start:17 stop:574 length:558 start_codon:yes stop_codon:yes gene_type:complete
MAKVREHGIAGEGKFGSGVGEFITVYTLIDITQTGVVAPYRTNVPAFVDDASQIVNNEQSWNKSRNQQSNCETLIQTISLRGNPMYIELPRKYTVDDIKQLGFGSSYKGKHIFWSTSFTVEQVGLYTERGQEDQPLSGLCNDFTNVPIVVNLTESIKLKTPIWEAVNSRNKNIYFVVNEKIPFNL